MEFTPVKIVTYILNFILIIITIYMIILLVKSDKFKIFPCYNITILSFIILIDNVLRVFHPGEKGDYPILQYGQAGLLTFLDKSLQSTITSQTIITYLGVCCSDIYFKNKKNEKIIFLSTLIIGNLINIILTIVYIKAEDITDYSYYYTQDSVIKRICDTVYNGVLLSINFFCCLVLLIYISKKKKQAKLGYIEDLDYRHQHTKIVFMLIFNSLMFIESFLIIYDKFPLDDVDLIYLISCLGILLYYTINKITIQETLKIFCKSYYNKKYPNINGNESLTDEGDEEKNDKRTDSFSDD